ncbi:hypothetical protein DPMN_011056 [Dreissena polymorpha]|uniref:Uncharacterized protein n=1 Tax=Dreissena polymorpha TaxID=45954 RepID=A0A9D4MZU9_DREPO|nr:hypothetical protein DPMN_011056 [Dreissena polymorpha]
MTGTATYTNQLKRKLQKLKKAFISTDNNNKTVHLPGLTTTSVTTDKSTLVSPASAEALYELSSNSNAHAPYRLQTTTVDVVTALPQNSATTETWSLPPQRRYGFRKVSKPHNQKNRRFPPQRHLGYPRRP